MYFDHLSLFAQSASPEQIGFMIGVLPGILILALVISGLLHLSSIVFNNPRLAFKKVFTIVFGVSVILTIIFTFTERFTQSVPPEQISYMIGYVTGAFLVIPLVISGLLHLFSIVFNNPRLAFKKVFAIVFGVSVILTIIFTFTERFTQSVPPEQISYMIGYVTGAFLVIPLVISGLFHLFSIVFNNPRLAFKKVFAIVFGVVFILTVVSALTKRYDNPRKIPANFDYGSWVGSTYKNDFFGLSITVPENWHIAGKKELDSLGQGEQDADFIDTDEMKRITKLAKVTTANLFWVSRYTEEEAIKQEVFNPSIALLTESISWSGRKINKTQYVNVVRLNLAKAIPGAIIKSETSKIISDKEFTSLQIEIHTDGVCIYQENLIYLKNNFALGFLLTWFDDSEKNQLDDIMATLTLD